jgi:predicted nucleic acid-binding protein
VKRVLADAGPLVAILAPEDQGHELCANMLKDLPGQLFSCWPVVAEAAWLLRPSPSAVLTLLNSIAKGFLVMLPLEPADAAAIAKILEKYSDLSPQLADAALVHLANRESIDTIFTLDRRDFSVYRSARNRRFRLIPDIS